VKLGEGFRRFSGWSAQALGSPWVFVANVVLILLWLAMGPWFGFSDTWQLWVNTATTVITYLAVFVIQNTQNRDTAAIQIKLDELIRATQGAHNAILDLEQMDEEQLARYLKHYEQLAATARRKLETGRLDTDSPELKAFKSKV
jgi:low affinity Fe/Cu permease